MAQYKKTKAIILLREDINDFDRRIIVFTKNFGKLSVISRGSRKITSKLAGYLELFTYLDLTLANQTIVGASTIKSFPGLRKDLNQLDKALIIVNLVNDFVFLDQTSKELFYLLIKTFSQEKINLKVFEKKFLNILGFSGTNPKNIKQFLQNNLS